MKLSGHPTERSELQTSNTKAKRSNRGMFDIRAQTGTLTSQLYKGLHKLRLPVILVSLYHNYIASNTTSALFLLVQKAEHTIYSMTTYGQTPWGRRGYAAKSISTANCIHKKLKITRKAISVSLSFMPTLLNHEVQISTWTLHTAELHSVFLTGQLPAATSNGLTASNRWRLVAVIRKWEAASSRLLCRWVAKLPPMKWLEAAARCFPARTGFNDPARSPVKTAQFRFWVAWRC